MKKSILLTTIIAGSWVGLPFFGQQSDAGDNAVVVLEEGVRAQVRLAFPAMTHDPALTGEARVAAQEIEQTLRDDLDSAYVFNVQGPTELAILTLDGNRSNDFEQYRSLGNEVVLIASVKAEGDRLVLDGWAYDLASGQSIIGKRYRGTLAQARLIAHYLADALHFQFTSKSGLSLTTIAFHSDRDGYQELYLMDYDGSNQRRISGHKSTSGFSDWSPSGDAIAYMSYYSGNPGIYHVDVESGRKVPIYDKGTLNLSPSFSPDGSLVAFAHSEDSNVDVYICKRQCDSPRRVTSSPAIDTNPSWSPDGTKLAFTSSRSGRPNIYVMGSDGSNLRRISFEGTYNDGASWRPDGKFIAYASRQGNKFRIAVTNLVDLNTRIAAEGPDSYEEPSFSPDGRRIVFTIKSGKSSQIYVMNTDGSSWQQLTHEGNSASPDWSGFPPSNN